MTTYTYTADTLLAGSFPLTTDSVTILTGQDLTRGAVLGRITASGKFILSLSAAGDGSETPYAVLAEDVDATAADKVATVYLTGEFNEDALTIGTGHTAAGIKPGLRANSIFLKTVV